VVAEIGLPRADLPGPGRARFHLADAAALHAALSRAWDLANALPDNPLHRFEEAVRDLPRETEAEQLVVERRGQDIFRESLLSYWDRRCPLTGIDDPALLRASHIKPWRDCATDAERLDPYNGLLLSALWDAAFDTGRVTFDDKGAPVFSSRLSDSAVTFLGRSGMLALTDQHRGFLRWHRKRVFQE
jgi:predicted restriction endonuclease